MVGDQHLAGERVSSATALLPERLAMATYDPAGHA